MGKSLTPDQFQKIARKTAERLEKKLGPLSSGKGFAIIVWDDASLRHVTTSRAEFAEMIGRQLSQWAREGIERDEREIAALKSVASSDIKPKETVQ